ncbi:MAG TPA: UDP-3-O-(3-hydroxymyristoyl)glucosamine N-acyltransferase, partial [Candidatus Hydrogenedentes bacterium]|nr:UDP-3-O-(3-hydroxymyristoyl)glucosamine N-acyltransferase [Candidatus Hydrogenedentota bacterium]
MKKRVHEIAELVDGTVVGDGDVEITGVNRIQRAERGDLTFMVGDAYARFIESTQASAIMVPRGFSQGTKPLIQVADPYAAFVEVLEIIKKDIERHPSSIHPSAVIGENVVMGDNVALGPYVCIADDCQIGDGVILYAGVYVGHSSRVGDNTIIHANATVRERVVIGARCLIHSGAIIGGDGFGFEFRGGAQQKIPQVGTVVLGDDVEVG